jgi:hypothetical protein
VSGLRQLCSTPFAMHGAYARWAIHSNARPQSRAKHPSPPIPDLNICPRTVQGLRSTSGGCQSLGWAPTPAGHIKIRWATRSGCCIA